VKPQFVIATLAALAAILIGLAIPGIGLAHSEFVSSVPAPNSAVAVAPTMVTVVFSEALDPKGSSLAVTGPNGSPANQGNSEIVKSDADRKTMTVSLKPGLGQGKYTVKWTSLSEDGDTLTDSFAFTVGTAQPNAPATSANPAAPAALPKSGGVPPELPMAAGVALLSLGLMLRSVRLSPR
jgi:methionine-rich copper-binding protein CopC